VDVVNPLAPSDPYVGRTAQLTSSRCVLNTGCANLCNSGLPSVFWLPCAGAVQLSPSYKTDSYPEISLSVTGHAQTDVNQDGRAARIDNSQYFVR
jgi:hypothetical protein